MTLLGITLLPSSSTQIVSGTRSTSELLQGEEEHLGQHQVLRHVWAVIEDDLVERVWLRVLVWHVRENLESIF